MVSVYGVVGRVFTVMPLLILTGVTVAQGANGRPKLPPKPALNAGPSREPDSFLDHYVPQSGTSLATMPRDPRRNKRWAPLDVHTVYGATNATWMPRHLCCRLPISNHALCLLSSSRSSNLL